MLPERAWRAFVAASHEAGRTEVTLELLAEISETPRGSRLSWLAGQKAA